MVRAQELLWVKTNQLQRIIRTGRTGHWLNHSKEHCLIGIKGEPKMNFNLDCDVVCAEVSSAQISISAPHRGMPLSLPYPVRPERTRPTTQPTSIGAGDKSEARRNV